MCAHKSSNTLFAGSEEANIDSAAPLAVRLRPRKLDEFIGQRHFLGSDKLLTRMLEADRLSSLIFYGPPGVGKTSLAAVITNYTKAEFYYLSAPAASVRDIRQIITAATDSQSAGPGPCFLSMKFTASAVLSRMSCWMMSKRGS